MADTKSRAVVVGAGLAGLRAVESLLRHGDPDEIVVVGDEPHLPYSRPPLSKELLSSAADPTWFRLPGSDRVEWRTSTKVASADLTSRQLYLASGETLAYDGLVIATGVRPRRVVNGTQPFALRALDDALRLREALGDARRAVIVGAGLLGCELASSLVDLGVSVEVVVGPDAAPMASLLGLDLARELQRRHEARGTIFHSGCAVLGYCKGKVWLSAGRHIVADLVIETVGSMPNVEWLDGNGLDLSNGVLCGPHLEVLGAEKVVACGDVARFPYPRYAGRLLRVEHWTLAGESGRRAGETLACLLAGELPGDGETFDPLPTFWSDQLGIRFQGLGLPMLGTTDARVLAGSLGGEPVLGYHHEDDLVGAVLLDRPELVAGYRMQVR